MGAELSFFGTTETYDMLGLAVYEGKPINVAKLSPLGHRVHNYYLAHKAVTDPLGDVLDAALSVPYDGLPLPWTDTAFITENVEGVAAIMKALWESYIMVKVKQYNLKIRTKPGNECTYYIKNAQGVPIELILPDLGPDSESDE
jgi:hypothetical protein